MRHIVSLAELKSLAGQEIAVSDWMPITQERINLFAQASGDQQWIHVDVERCRTESPYGAPIAHGFLTLSLLPLMLDAAITFPACKLAINYGLNKVRFPSAVHVGHRVRGRMLLQAVADIAGGIQMLWEVVVECEGSEKPACVAELILRHYY